MKMDTKKKRSSRGSPKSRRSPKGDINAPIKAKIKNDQKLYFYPTYYETYPIRHAKLMKIKQRFYLLKSKHRTAWNVKDEEFMDLATDPKM